jgi:P-type Cu2+ transporter
VEDHAVVDGAVCTHCGLPVPLGLLHPGAQQQFCCSGCAAAWRLLNDGGLAEFYRLRDATAETPGRPASEDPGAEAFDGSAFRAAWARPLAHGDELIAWYLEGLHCPACVWLVEQLPRLLPGVRWARLDLGTAQLRVAYDPQHAGPGAQARLLAGLGYRARPFRADAVTRALTAEQRNLLVRVAVAAASAVGTMHLTATLTAGEFTGDLDRGWSLGFAWGAILVALPGCLWAAMPLHRGALSALRAGRWSVDLAASLAIILALVGSAALAWSGSLASYADAAAMFAALLLTARLAVVQARRRVARAAGGLAHLLPLTARRVSGERMEEVAIEALVPGDVVAVASGQVVPGDGTVLSGSGAIDIAVLTGEPRPVAVAGGDGVIAGATCRSGDLRLRLDAVGADTRLATILAQAAPQRSADSDGQAQVDTTLRLFAPATLCIALVAGIAWGWHAGWPRGAEIALAVVVAACPCAIGLAAPLSQALAAAAAARRGLLLRDPAILARIDGVRHVVCDKTGTLTEGRMRVATVTGDAPWSAVLAMAGRSGHPAAQALTTYLTARDLTPASLSDWRDVPGQGLTATADGHALRLGGTTLTGVDAAPGGRSRIGVQVDGVLRACIDLDDPLRPDAAAMIAAWTQAGAQVHLASGDHPAAVADLAARLGINDARGGMSPEDKAAFVVSLRQHGGVAAVGDGVNDAAMLAAADVAVGVSGGLEAAMDRCHAFCARPNEAGPRDLWLGAQRNRRSIRRLLWISAAYNLLAIAGAAAGLFGPLICAVAMPLSSLTVVAMALRARPFA